MPPITNPPPHRYAAVGFDRAAPRRKDPAWIEARRADPRSLVLMMRGLDPVITDDLDPELDLVALETFVRATSATIDADAVFLGEHRGRAVFATGVAADHPAADRARDVRQFGARVTVGEAGLAAYARALAYWHQTHRYCGACGGRAVVRDAGHARYCPACERTLFPRTDPAVIVLVSSGAHCLLGRSHRFPEHMYSTLAGFVEPGESLEDTVRREIFEEAGVRVTSMRYCSSQPWPFPASLMLGFQAEAEARTLTIDTDELADARWFHRDELLDPEKRPISLPRADSIARFLIENWLYASEAPGSSNP